MAADAVTEGLAKGDTRPRSSASGRPSSSGAWTACAGWSANTTTASASAGSSSSYPHFKGHLTDLLIGDLFKDEVDAVVEPMNKVRAELNAAKK